MTTNNKYERYNHHDTNVWVRSDLKGLHRKYCLCHSCKKLNMIDRNKNCPIAKDLFNNCVKHNVVTPVFECPNFEEDILKEGINK